MTMVTVVGRLFEAHLTVVSLGTSIAFYRDGFGLDREYLSDARVFLTFEENVMSTLNVLWTTVPCLAFVAAGRSSHERPWTQARRDDD